MPCRLTGRIHAGYSWSYAALVVPLHITYHTYITYHTHVRFCCQFQVQITYRACVRCILGAISHGYQSKRHEKSCISILHAGCNLLSDRTIDVLRFCGLINLQIEELMISVILLFTHFTDRNAIQALPFCNLHILTNYLLLTSVRHGKNVFSMS